MTFSNRLLKTLAKDVKMTNGKTLEENFYAEAQRLRDCIQKRLDNYLNTHPYRYGDSHPVYVRTGGLSGSLKAEDFISIKIVGNTLKISLFFDEGAIHQSGDGIKGWNGTGERVNTAYLLNYGYRVTKDVWFKNIPYFGYRPAAHFIEDGIADFNAVNPMGIKVTVKSNGYRV